MSRREMLDVMGLAYMIREAAAEIFALQILAEQRGIDNKTAGDAVTTLYYVNGARKITADTLRIPRDQRELLDNTRRLFKAERAKGNDAILWREFPDEASNGLMRVAFVPLSSVAAVRALVERRRP